MLRCTCWLARVGAFFARRRIGLILLFLANIIHPLIHGTPLDSGSWDQALVMLNGWAYSDVST